MRFGIIVPETQRIIEERGRLEVERKSIGKGTVKVRIPGARDEVRIETEIFVPQGLKGVLPDKYLKVRFAAPFIDFFLWPRYNSECSFTFRLPDIFERHQLRRLQIISKLLQLLHQSALNNQGIEIEMLFESKPLNVGRSNYIPSIDEELVEISETLQQAWQIAQYFDLDQNIEVIPIELMHQRDPIKFLSGILGREKSYFRIDMLLDNDINDNDLYCVPLAGSVRLGETRLFVAVALLGKLELLGASEENRSQYRLQVDHVEVCKQYVFDINEEKTPTIDILKQIVIEKYNEKATIVSLENY
ncbi:MAG: hypothetical protein HC828_22115 [Blastochloris sp.]|nr:hypothetical protein [Blastochloris sp.]